MLYELIPILLGIIIIILGLIMAILPRISTKKDRRDDPKAISKTRMSGVVMVILGILVVVLRFLFFT